MGLHSCSLEIVLYKIRAYIRMQCRSKKHKIQLEVSSLVTGCNLTYCSAILKHNEKVTDTFVLSISGRYGFCFGFGYLSFDFLLANGQCYLQSNCFLTYHANQGDLPPENRVNHLRRLPIQPYLQKHRNW